jgi:hypothetical protein
MSNRGRAAKIRQRSRFFYMVAIWGGFSFSCRNDEYPPEMNCSCYIEMKCYSLSNFAPGHLQSNFLNFAILTLSKIHFPETSSWWENS